MVLSHQQKEDLSKVYSTSVSWFFFCLEFYHFYHYFLMLLNKKCNNKFVVLFCVHLLWNTRVPYFFGLKYGVIHDDTIPCCWVQSVLCEPFVTDMHQFQVKCFHLWYYHLCGHEVLWIGLKRELIFKAVVQIQCFDIIDYMEEGSAKKFDSESTKWACPWFAKS